MFEIISNLHFLRPWWFLALLPIFWIIWRIWQTNQKQGAWHQVIEPKFRTLLLGENTSTEPTLNEKMGYMGLALAWVFAVLALSGPWVKSVDVPAQKSQQGVVIVMDLSLSMLADDIAPNRLARVKYTLTDVLKQNPDYAVGMVAYAGTAHTIVPISDDNKTLLNILPSLNPTVMPKFGSEPLQGLQQADQLLTGAQITRGHIIWITDDIETSQMASVESWINSKPYSLSLLTVGSENGGVVQIPGYGLLKDDEGKLILPPVPLARFAELEDDSKLTWQHLQIAMDNTKNLLPAKMIAKEALATEKQQDKDVNHPLDIGFFFLFLLIPLAAFIFRRGTLLNFAAILVIPAFLFQPNDAFAESLISDLGDVFKSQDQQGYQAWEEQKYEKAEALFENKQWRASALYKQGKYKEAARIYQLDESAIGFYNQGNAWTQAMQLDKAIKAYEQALLIDPSLQIAKDNLEIVRQLKDISESKDVFENEPNPTSTANQTEQKQQQQDEEQQTKKQTQKQQQTQANEKGDTDTQEKGSELNSSQISSQNSESGDHQDKKSAEETKKGEDGSKSNAAQSAQNQPNNDLNQDPAEGDANKQAEGAEKGLAEAQKPAQNSDENQNKEGEAKAQRLANDNDKNADDAAAKAPGKGDVEPLSEEEQAQLNWLNQIPDQPGVFLKRKFEYQFQQNPGANSDNNKQW